MTLLTFIFLSYFIWTAIYGMVRLIQHKYLVILYDSDKPFKINCVLVFLYHLIIDLNKNGHLFVIQSVVYVIPNFLLHQGSWWQNLFFKIWFSQILPASLEFSIFLRLSLIFCIMLGPISMYSQVLPCD